jgi:hypothetical protein
MSWPYNPSTKSSRRLCENRLQVYYEFGIYSIDGLWEYKWSIAKKTLISNKKKISEYPIKIKVEIKRPRVIKNVEDKKYHLTYPW